MAVGLAQDQAGQPLRVPARITNFTGLVLNHNPNEFGLQYTRKAVNVRIIDGNLLTRPEISAATGVEGTGGIKLLAWLADGRRLFFSDGYNLGAYFVGVDTCTYYDSITTLGECSVTTGSKLVVGATGSNWLDYQQVNIADTIYFTNGNVATLHYIAGDTLLYLDDNATWTNANDTLKLRQTFSTSKMIDWATENDTLYLAAGGSVIKIYGDLGYTGSTAPDYLAEGYVDSVTVYDYAVTNNAGLVKVWGTDIDTSVHYDDYALFVVGDTNFANVWYGPYVIEESGNDGWFGVWVDSSWNYSYGHASKEDSACYGHIPQEDHPRYVVFKPTLMANDWPIYDSGSVYDYVEDDTCCGFGSYGKRVMALIYDTTKSWTTDSLRDGVYALRMGNIADQHHGYPARPYPLRVIADDTGAYAIQLTHARSSGWGNDFYNDDTYYILKMPGLYLGGADSIPYELIELGRDRMEYARSLGENTKYAYSEMYAYLSLLGDGYLYGDDPVVGIRQTENALVYFCYNSIKQRTGLDENDFSMSVVSNNIGAINNRLITENQQDGTFYFVNENGLYRFYGMPEYIPSEFTRLCRDSVEFQYPDELGSIVYDGEILIWYPQKGSTTCNRIVAINITPDDNFGSMSFVDWGFNPSVGVVVRDENEQETLYMGSRDSALIAIIGGGDRTDEAEWCSGYESLDDPNSWKFVGGDGYSVDWIAPDSGDKLYVDFYTDNSTTADWIDTLTSQNSGLNRFTRVSVPWTVQGKSIGIGFRIPNDSTAVTEFSVDVVEAGKGLSR